MAQCRRGGGYSARGPASVPLWSRGSIRRSAAVFLGILLVCCNLVSAEESDGTTGGLYTLVLNDDGRSGNCRGNGGSADKVHAKSKKLGTQVECSGECDRLSSCVGYTYSPVSENCDVHGNGMSGSCSRAGKTHVDECGTCSVAGKMTRSACGSCSIPPSSGWTETENFCASTIGAVWTPGTWTAATWTPPGNGWTADSHSTWHVHTVDGAAGAYCYDKYPYDGIAQCKSTLETERDHGEHWCQIEFDETQDKTKCPLGCIFSSATPRTEKEPGKPPSCIGREDLTCTEKFNAEATADNCVGACTFVAQPAKNPSLAVAHDPTIHLPGWAKELRSWGDAVGKKYEKGMIGECRVEGNGLKPINSKWCPGMQGKLPTSTCTASNGMSVGLQEGCAQACLDDPSGTCVGYAHSSSSCILYSPFADKHLVHHNGDTWISDARASEPCISYNSPLGCKTIDTSKPDPSFICVLLKMNPDRWLAWGPTGKRQDVGLRIITTGVEKNAYTEEVQTALRLRIAALALVNFSSYDDSQVALTVSEKDVLSTYQGKEVVLDFVVAANASTATAMKSLLDAQVSTSAMANGHIRTILPTNAFVAAVHPSGAGTWPGLTTEVIVLIIAGCVVASALSVGLAWKYLMRKAKNEAQTMHFEVSGNMANDVEEDLDGVKPRFSIQEMDDMNKDIESNLGHPTDLQSDKKDEEQPTQEKEKPASLVAI